MFIDLIGCFDLVGMVEDWVGDLCEMFYKCYKVLLDELIVLLVYFMIIDELNDNGSVVEKLGILFVENYGLNIKDEVEFRYLVIDNLLL